jgi:hypothetical protein
VNKPAFLKLLSTLMTMPVVSPVLAWALGEKLQNWAGNIGYTTERLDSPNSSEQVRDFVGKQAKRKVLGTRHCFNGIADSAEHFVPRQHAIEAILAVERLRDRVGRHLMISEIRSIAADDFGMSPCYKAPRVTIHFTWKPDWSAVQHLLPIIERERGPFNARPRWGEIVHHYSRYTSCQVRKAVGFCRLVHPIRPKKEISQRVSQAGYFCASVVIEQ